MPVFSEARLFFWIPIILEIPIIFRVPFQPTLSTQHTLRANSEPSFRAESEPSQSRLSNKAEKASEKQRKPINLMKYSLFATQQKEPYADSLTVQKSHKPIC